MSKYSQVLKRHGLPTSPLVASKRSTEDSPSAGSPRLGSLDVDFTSRLLLAETGEATSPSGPAPSEAAPPGVATGGNRAAAAGSSAAGTSGATVLGASSAMSRGELDSGHGELHAAALQQAMAGAEVERDLARPRQLDFNRQRMRERLLRNKASR